MRVRPLLFFALLTSVSLLFVRRASAGELTYEAPDGCPTHEDVAGRVARRASESRDSSVTIHKKPSGYAAHLSIGGGDDTLERDVEGRTCDAVVDAAVLVLSLDRPEPPPVPVAAASVVPAVDTPAAAVRSPAEPSRKPLSIAVGVDVEARELSYNDTVGGTVFGELGAPDLFGWRRYRPSVRLGATFLTANSGHFIGATLDVCPIGGALIASARTELTLAACGAFDGGSAEDVSTGSWFDLGGVARATLQIGRAESTRWFVDLSVGIFARVAAGAGDVTTGGPALVGFNGPAGTPAITPIYSEDASYPEGHRAMPLLAIGGGIVFP